MIPEIDNIDLKILQQLQSDSNLTNKELASAVHLSTTPTFERVKRLEKEGYIKRYAAILDAEKLNCGFVAFCFLKMKQHTHDNAIRIMEAVQSIPELPNVTTYPVIMIFC